MNRAFFLLCLALVLFFPTRAQNSSSMLPLKISMDYARFRGDSANVYLEVYYSVPENLLTYVRDSAGLSGAVEVTMALRRGDVAVWADRWLVPHRIKDSTRASMNLIGLSTVMLPEGQYTLTLKARDRYEPSRTDSATMTVPIKLPGTTRLVLSDVELSTSIKQGKQGSQFFKNTLEVVPSVECIFTENQSCFVYAEIYNVLAGEDRSDYVLKTVVTDAIGREVIARDKVKKRSGESSVVVDNIVTKDLQTGTYTVMLSLIDSSRTTVSAAGRRFFVYNKTLGIDSSMMSLRSFVPSEEFARMSEEELDREFHWARYESGQAERSQYEKLSGPESKRTFLQEFWSKREQGFRLQYLQRVRFANENYREMGLEGYRTDRGRVHIVYGVPDDIDRHPNEADTRPYEVWSYNSIQGGVIFVFVLRQTGTDYELVHSTHRNELHNPNWANYTYPK